MISIDEINLLKGQNEALKKQNQELQKENKHLNDLLDNALKEKEELAEDVEKLTISNNHYFKIIKELKQLILNNLDYSIDSVNLKIEVE